MTDVETREQALMKEFEGGLAADAVPALAARIAALEAANAGIEGELEAARDRAAAAEKDRDAAVARADAAVKKANAKVERGPAPAKMRKLADMDDAFADGELQDAIAKADKVEIAFSDGNREIPGIDPVVVSGEVWRPHSRGLMLKDPVEIEGPGGGTSVSIDGYALLLDGKQVAYSRRSDALQIGPGQRVQLADDIIF